MFWRPDIARGLRDSGLLAGHQRCQPLPCLSLTCKDRGPLWLHRARLDHPGSQFKSPNPSCRVPLAWKVPGIRMWTSLSGHCSAIAEGQGGVRFLGGGQMLLRNLSQASARRAQQPLCPSSGPGEGRQTPCSVWKGWQTKG